MTYLSIATKFVLFIKKLLIICLFIFRSKLNADVLFPSEEEDEEPKAPKVQKKRKTSTSAEQAGTSKRTKPIIRAVPSTSKATSHDLFGTDSDEDELNESSETAGKKSATPLISYFTRRLANGMSRQSGPKTGSHFIEVKIYKKSEIENVSPMNRWRHSIITIKNQTNDDTQAWRHLTKFIQCSRKEFGDYPPTFMSNYY